MSVVCIVGVVGLWSSVPYVGVILNSIQKCFNYPQKTGPDPVVGSSAYRRMER